MSRSRFWYIPGLMAFLTQIERMTEDHGVRISALEEQMASIEEDLKAAQDAIDAHNVADNKYKQDAIQRITVLEQQIATGAPTSTLIALAAGLRAHAEALPTMDLSKDDPANQTAPAATTTTPVATPPATSPAAPDAGAAAPTPAAPDVTATGTTSPTGGAPTT